MKVAIAGASGFIGSHLLKFLQEKGHTVFPHPRRSMLPDGIDVVINLSGESIFGRWTEEKKRNILESRIHSTRALCDQILILKNPPKLYIGASAVGFYGDRGEEVLTENSFPGSGFLSEVCQEWEKIPLVLKEKNIRVVAARFGIVFGKGGGALEKMLAPFELGFGGVIGSGKQVMSWIALDDLLRAVEYVIETPQLEGPINFVSPNPSTNRELTRQLGALLKRPTYFRIPKFVFSLLFGEGKEVYLSSAKVLPQRLLESGFQFHYPDLKKYLSINLEKESNS